MADNQIKNRVSGSTRTFSSVTNTHIFELLPGGIPQTEIDSFFGQYERLKGTVPPGTVITDVIFSNEVTASLNTSFTDTGKIVSLVDDINSLIVQPKSHQYLISEGNELTNGQKPLYPQTDFNNIINILNDEGFKNASLLQTISGSLSVVNEFSSTMETLQDEFDSFNKIVLAISSNSSKSQLALQSPGASINKSIQLAEIFFDKMLEVSTTFLNTTGYDITRIFEDTEELDTEMSLDFVSVSKVVALQNDNRVDIQVFLDSSSPIEILFSEITAGSDDNRESSTSYHITPGEQVLGLSSYTVFIPGLKEDILPEVYYTFNIPIADIEDSKSKTYNILFRKNLNETESISKDITTEVVEAISLIGRRPLESPETTQ